MNKYQQLAYEFQLAAKVLDPLPTEPKPLPPWAVDLWRRLILEEKDELIQALESGDIAQIVHEQCDLLYVLYGCAVWRGQKYSNHVLHRDDLYCTRLKFSGRVNDVVSAMVNNLRPEEVNYTDTITALGLLHRNELFNIDLWPAYQAIHASNMAKMAGGTIYREDGKIQKPDGWQPADIKAVLEAQGVTL